MSFVKDSFFFRLLAALWRAVESSWICRAFLALGERVRTLWERSFTGHFFYTDSRLAAVWEESLIRCAAEWAINLPLRVFQRLYRRFRREFDDSFFAGLAFELGSECCLASAWFTALFLSIPYERWSNRYSFLASVLVLALYHAGVMRRERHRISLGRVGPWAALFFAAVAASVPLSNYPGLSARFLSYHVTCALTVLTLVNAVENSRQLLRLAGGLATGIFVAACGGVYQRVVLKIKPVIAYIDPGLNSSLPGRVYSFFENPNAFGHLLLLALPILAALAFSSRRRIGRVCAAGVFCLALACIAMTYCRAAWIGLAAAALVYVLLWNWKLLPLLAAAALAAVPFLPASVLERLTTIVNLNDTTTSSRFPQYAAVLRLLAGEPVTGAGLGTDAVRRVIQIKSLYQNRTPFVHSHNTFLQVWAECGALGVFTLVGAILSAVRSAVMGVRRCSDAAARHMAIGGAAALAGASVCGLADYLWTYPRIMYVFWFVFALTLAAARLCCAGASGPDAGT